MCVHTWQILLANGDVLRIRSQLSCALEASDSYLDIRFSYEPIWIDERRVLRYFQVSIVLSTQDFYWSDKTRNGKRR